jgi:DNA-directed RNA polymerase subunit RPC12/RpoP
MRREVIRTDVRCQDPSERALVTTRYRCTSCGNLTRFDVTTTRRTRAFHHYTVGGDLAVEDEQVLSQTVEAVACRWCGSGTGVVEMADGDAGADPAPPADPV